jgi:N-acetylglutamate synthase-like GNAT family acetyltransferase
MNQPEAFMADRQKADIIIEKALPEDLPVIMELLKLANMHYIGSPEMPSLAYENYFVARIKGNIVGFSGYKILSPTEAKTELMVVHPDCRGLGIGDKLQTRRMEDMLTKGIRTLTTNTDLPATIKWYQEHFGYRKIGVLKKIHEFGDPAIDYWTTLQVDLVQWNNTRRRNNTND